MTFIEAILEDIKARDMCHFLELSVLWSRVLYMERWFKWWLIHLSWRSPSGMDQRTLVLWVKCSKVQRLEFIHIAPSK